jgi:hypothetical protein
MSELGKREYFLDEWHRLYELMGTKPFWSNLESASNAYYGLLYVYAHTTDLQKNDEIAMQAITKEYDMRLMLVLINIGKE